MRVPLLEQPSIHDHHESNPKLSWLLYFQKMPLYLPRRLTIPDVSEQRWSKPLAVASVFFSPILLATIWIPSGLSPDKRSTIYMAAVFLGTVLAILAAETTEACNPPRGRSLLTPWLAGGFLMSVVWAYITARELVSLLASLGYILGISPSVLGVTILAWGNSTGDLIANVAMAVNGGEDGAQIAISGCYAGPIFNTLVGLGVPLVLSTWSSHPAPFLIPKDISMVETSGFLLGGLVWALVVLHTREMKLDRVLGMGLLGIYLGFLCLRLFESIGLVKH